MQVERSWKEQVISGLRITGLVILAFCVFLMLLGGAGIAFSVFPGSKAFGWASFIIGVTILVRTVERWVKMLPGLLFLATLNALVVTKTGHLMTNPPVPIPRQVALAGALLFAASCVLSMQFYSRRLGAVDRVALLSFVACTLWGMLSNFVLTPLILGVIIFVLAWANHRIRRRRNHKELATG